MPVQTLKWHDDALVLLDQTRLPVASFSLLANRGDRGRRGEPAGQQRDQTHRDQHGGQHREDDRERHHLEQRAHRQLHRPLLVSPVLVVLRGQAVESGMYQAAAAAAAAAASPYLLLRKHADPSHTTTPNPARPRQGGRARAEMSELERRKWLSPALLGQLTCGDSRRCSRHGLNRL